VTRHYANVVRPEPVRQEVEKSLRTVMCRTERLSTTARTEMEWSKRLTPRPNSSRLMWSRTLPFRPLARALEHPDVIEYWKSASYLLNFMED
jgi:hypothetical protein